MKNLKIKFKKFFLKFLLINDSPQRIAGGTAIGVFLGIVPGEGLTAAIIISSLLKLNRLSAMAGAIAFNMWSTFVILPLAAIVGAFLFNKNSQELMDNFNSNYHLIGYKVFLSKIIFFDLALPLAIGFILTAGIISAIFYFVIFYLLKNHKITLLKKFKSTD